VWCLLVPVGTFQSLPRVSANASAWSRDYACSPSYLCFFSAMMIYQVNPTSLDTDLMNKLKKDLVE
jgi:hypothetical protein